MIIKLATTTIQTIKMIYFKNNNKITNNNNNNNNKIKIKLIKTK